MMLSEKAKTETNTNSGV